MITPMEAIASLRPGVEWTMNGDDIAGIEWHTPSVDPVTQADVEAEMARLEAAAQQAAADAAQDRADAIAHAKSLGFTDAMIAVMYPNLTSA